MTPLTVLTELLARVGAGRGAAALVSDEDLNRWPSVAVTNMKASGLLTRARPASSTVCPGCERECVRPVHTLPTKREKPSSFIVCEKRSDTARVSISTERLTRWQCTADAICNFVAHSLELRRSDKRPGSSDFWEIGMATGDKRSQILCLNTDGVLNLVAGDNTMPLADLISYRDDAYSLDGGTIRKLVDSATTADNRYTPSNAKREARKLDTQVIYKSWQKKYRALKTKQPNKSDLWCSQQIAKMGIAKGRDAETIRKHMKK